MTADLYQNHQITKQDAFKMTSFCSTSGPMFIIGAVGTGMLLSPKYGYIIFTAHVIGALINGLLYKNITINEEKKFPTIGKNAENFNLGEIVTDSTLSILSVGTIITIFFVIIHSLMPIFNLLPSSLVGITEGIIEITKGCIDITASLPSNLAILACTFVISFGGISTILQSITMLNKLQMPIRLFILQKFTHAVCATLVAGILILFI